MRSRVPADRTSEAGDFTDEIRRIFDDLDRSLPGTLAGECAPTLDVHETDNTIEVLVDLPDVEAAGIRVVIKGNTVLIAGRKTPRRGRPDSSFHLVERGYGRFARAVRLVAPCDTSKASALLDKGELRITLPKMNDQRGRAIDVPVRTLSN